MSSITKVFITLFLFQTVVMSQETPPPATEPGTAPVAGPATAEPNPPVPSEPSPPPEMRSGTEEMTDSGMVMKKK
jgi:hypothetical protein